MKFDRKTLGRILILRSMLALDPRAQGVSGIEIADRTSTQRDHALLRSLSLIGRRGVGARLNGMSLAGLVTATYDNDQRLHLWRITRLGRELAASLPTVEGSA